MQNYIALDVGHRLRNLEVSDTQWLHHDLELLSAFERLQFVEIKFEVLNLFGLGQLGQRIDQIFEELLFVFKVLGLLLLNFDFNDCLEYAHNLVGRDLAALVLSHLIGKHLPEARLSASCLTSLDFNALER